MSFLDKMLHKTSPSHGKKLVIIDTNAQDLTHYKEKYARKGYRVQTILLIGADSEISKHQFTHAAAADNNAKTEDEMLAHLSGINPDFILMDSLQGSTIKMDAKHVAQLAQHALPDTIIVQHTGRSSRLAHSERIENAGRSGSNAIAARVAKNGDAAHNAFLRLLKQQQEAAAPKSHQRSKGRTL